MRRTRCSAGKFGPVLADGDLVVGKSERHLSPWERLDNAFQFARLQQRASRPTLFPFSRRRVHELSHTVQALTPKWVEAVSNNITSIDLLLGTLRQDLRRVQCSGCEYWETGVTNTPHSVPRQM